MNSASSSELLGLIAGGTQMPRVVAREARTQGIEVLAVGIEGITEPGIEGEVCSMTWLSWGDLPGFLRVLEVWRTSGVQQAVMAGKVEQRRIYDEGSSAELKVLLKELPTRHTDTLMGAAAQMLEAAGVELVDSTQYLQAYLAGEGVLGSRPPDARESEDIEHGWHVAKVLGGLDIGQTVVVKDKAVVAVEGMEGTDACITRAGKLAGSGAVVVKVAKPQQDLRFDVPVVGIGTIESLVQSGASAMALEAGITVLFDRAQLVKLADSSGIALVARSDG